MNLKEKLVSKLLDIGKKHRILVYPMLALVAVITAISHAVCWGRGNGKKMVASILVVTLLITQSLFLTSSADYSGDAVGTPTDASNEQDADLEDLSADDMQIGDMQAGDQQGDGSYDAQYLSALSDDDPLVEDGETVGDTDPNAVNVTYHAYTTSATQEISNISISCSPTDETNTAIAVVKDSATIVGKFGLDTNYFTTDGKLYSDAACQNEISGDSIPVVQNGTYDVYVKITRTAYLVSFGNVGDAGAVTSVRLTTNETDTGNVEQKLSFTVPGTDETYHFYKRGYKYISLGGKTIGQNVEISSTNVNTNEITLDAGWESIGGMKITYKLYDPGVVDVVGPKYAQDASTESAEFSYGDTVNLLTLDEETYITNKGYYFAGWKVEGTDQFIDTSSTTSLVASLESEGIKLVLENGELSADQNVKPVTLVGQWEYRKVDIYLDGNKVTDTDIKITGTYGTAMTHTLTAKYKKGEIASDTIQFTGMDNLTGTGGLGSYGLSMTPQTNSFSISGTPNNVTGTEKIYSFTVTDTNDASITETFNLVFEVNPLPVYIGTVKSSTTDGTLTKVYDNSDKIAVKSEANVTAAAGATPACIADDGLKVTFDSTATLLSNGTVAGKDVGTGKTIRLTNPVLVATNPAKTACYELKDITDGYLDVANAASVTKRTLNVKVEYKDGVDSVKFGEDSPKCVLTITNPENIADGNDGEEQNAYTANPDGFMTTYLGLDNQSSWLSNRKIYSSPGTEYYIQPTFTFNGAGGGNYEVVVATPPKFSVTRDASDGHFRVKETPAGGYYPSYTIVAEGAPGYDMVRILESSDTDIPDTMDRLTAKGLFEYGQAGKTEDGTYNNIRFQLYNSTTDAVSSIYTVSEEIKIDKKIPVYVSHTVAPSGFVNQLGFGTYYHSQNNVTGMTITVQYRAEQSACEKLQYYFAGADATVEPATISTTRMTDKGNGIYEATIVVGNNTSGQLVLWATDSKGKDSAKTKLVCYTTNTDAALTDEYYEWMVEDIPSVAVMRVTGNGEAAITDKWYNTITASIEATDVDSGLDEAEWTIQTPSATVTETASAYGANATKDAKVTEYTFNHTITGGVSNDYTPGEYRISATVKDNAGNVVQVAEQGPFLFDGIKPDITLSDEGKSDSQYQSDVTITMDVTEGELESGIDSIKLYKESTDTEPLATWSATGAKTWSDTYDVTDSGKYILVVTDIAGNEASDSVSYSHISSEKPAKPSITITKGENGAIGNSGWLIGDKPKVTITSTTETKDDHVPVKTYYKVIYTDENGRHETSDSFDTETHTFELVGQGDVTIEAYAESESKKSSDTATENAKVDITGPVVTIKDSVVDANGDVTINFQAVDLISGVDTEKVLVNGNPVAVTDTDGVATGSFKADGSGTYEIVAYDNAGNASDPVSFEPLRLSVTPITSITSTGAHIEAKVIKGTNTISPSLCYIEYKKVTETSYDTVLVNKNPTEDNGIEMIYNFSKLSPNTVYNYRVHAATLNADETRVVEGSFRTLSGNSTTTVYGSATYDSDLPEEVKADPIFVNLYNGNTIIAGETVTSADNPRYMFTGVSDGTYRIVATNGTLTKEASVTIVDGMVTYPENYSVAGGINFKLSGLSTNVVLDDGNVPIAVDGLEKIFDNSNYNGNVTDDDLRVVANGGSIDITLHASYIKVNDVTETEKGIFVDKLGSRTEIVRYINLYIVMNVYEADGTLYRTANLTRLYEPLTISFPLEDLAGQTIHVASLHNTGNDYDFKNWTDASEARLTHDYVIITTDRFSTYALYRVTNPKTFTVVWKDGDGNVMKTETVEEGSAAIPPEETPKKSPTADYKYIFEGWDQDYTNVTQDMVILAWFYSEKINNNPEDPGTTEDPATTENPGNNSGNNNQNVNPGDNKPGDNTQNADVENPSKDKTKYTYIGGAGSPQTGDATPIVLLGFAIVFAGAGIILLIKKKKMVSKN